MLAEPMEPAPMEAAPADAPSPAEDPSPSLPRPPAARPIVASSPGCEEAIVALMSASSYSSSKSPTLSAGFHDVEPRDVFVLHTRKKKKAQSIEQT